jgi:hypothetical protein
MKLDVPDVRRTMHVPSTVVLSITLLANMFVPSTVHGAVPTIAADAVDEKLGVSPIEVKRERTRIETSQREMRTLLKCAPKFIS